MNDKIAIIGAGSWGTAVACSLGKNGHRVVLWSHTAGVADSINTDHINEKYLPKHKLPKTVSASTDMEEVCKDASFIFLASPSLYLTSAVEELLKFAPFSHDDGKMPYPTIAVLTKGFIPDENGEPQFIIAVL